MTSIAWLRLALVACALGLPVASLAAPCELVRGEHYDVDGAGRFVLRDVTILRPEGCTWRAPRGVVLNGHQLSNPGAAAATIETDPGATALHVSDRRGAPYLIDNLVLAAPGGRGIEFQLTDPFAAAGSRISRVAFRGVAFGVWGLPSQVLVTDSTFTDVLVGVVAHGGAGTGRVFHATVERNVFRNVLWAVTWQGDWQRSLARDGWSIPELRNELTVRGNTIECQDHPWSAGVILLRVSEGGVEENTILGCRYGVFLQESHRILVRENTIDDQGEGRPKAYTTRGVVDLYSAGWAVYHNDIHAMWGVQSVQRGGAYLMQDAVWWNRIAAVQGYRVHVEELVAYPPDEERSQPDKEWAGNNHYPYGGPPSAEAGGAAPLVVTGGAQQPYPGFQYPYAHDPLDPEVPCESSQGAYRWTWVNPGAVNQQPDDVKGNYAAGYVAAPLDANGDGIHDEPVVFPGHATLACDIPPGHARFKAGPFWSDRCFRLREFEGAGRGRSSPGPNVAPCQ